MIKYLKKIRKEKAIKAQLISIFENLFKEFDTREKAYEQK